MTALVLAFDGLVANTLDARVESLQFALNAEGALGAVERIRVALPGRTFHEAATAIIGGDDATLVDLAALRAQQEFSRRLAHGVSLAVNARAYIERQRATGMSLVLRADSLRRDVERVLQLTDLELAFTLVRCPDDLPRARGMSTIEASYAAISTRLDALRTGERRALEYAADAADVARRFVGQAASAQGLDVDASHH